MDRTIQNIGKGGLTGGIAGLLVDLIGQCQTIKLAGYPLTLNNILNHYEPQKGLKGTLIGASVGASLGLAYSILVSDEDEPTERFNQNEFLKQLLKQSRVDPNALQSKSDRKIVAKVTRFLSETFAGILFDKPLLAGSVARRTAVHPASDYDIAFVIKAGTGTLEQIQDRFCEELTHKYKGAGYTVRQQNRSIGLLIDRPDGSMLKIDVLPARARGDYKATGNLTIWDRRRNGPLKTNVKIHNQSVIGQPQARDSIRLLKLYRDSNGLPLPTPLINHVIPGNLSKRGGFSSMAGNLKFSVECLAMKLDNQTVKDPANSNNNLLGVMSYRTKSQIQQTLLSDLGHWQKNPNHLKTMFANVQY